MDKSKSYIIGFTITLFFVLLMVNQDSNSNPKELIYKQTYVDSLKYEIQLRDSLIKDFLYSLLALNLFR